MTGGDERGTEERFFGEDPPGAEPAPPPKRPSALLVRNPAIAVVALLACGYLLWDLAPEVAYFFSARDPIDLGGPGAYHLDRVRENRLVQIRGELSPSVSVTEVRSGAARTVGRLAGTPLVVDRPGRGGPPVFEGRVLPARMNGDYAAPAAALRDRGAQLGERWLVLRDGDRPRDRWLPVGASAILVLLVAVNLRALAKALAR